MDPGGLVCTMKRREGDRMQGTSRSSVLGAAVKHGNQPQIIERDIDAGRCKSYIFHCLSYNENVDDRSSTEIGLQVRIITLWQLCVRERNCLRRVKLGRGSFLS